jgi:PAS domain S-box-containing protein
VPAVLVFIAGASISAAAFQLVRSPDEAPLIAAEITWQPVAVLVGGLGFAALLAAYVFVVTDRVVAVHGLVNQRTRQLRESEERLHVIANSTKDGIIVVDLEGKAAFWSTGAARILGYAPEEVLGRCIYEVLVAPHDAVQCAAGMRKFLAGNEAVALNQTIEFDGLRSDGRQIPLEVSLSSAMIDGRRHALAVVRDITERRATEAALRDRDRQLREAQQIAHVGSWEWNILTGKVVWSDEEHRLFGLPYDATPTVRSFFDRVHPEDRPGVSRPIRRALVRGPCDFVHRIVLPDGTIRYLHQLGQVTFDERRKPVRMVGTTQDITALTLAKQRAAAEEARTKTLLELTQMSGQSAEEIANYALEGVVALTASTIGYIAFANEDETVLTMQCWSKTAMHQCMMIDKPITYRVEDTGLWGEAVRQRKPIIVNDYAAANPLKKGTPAGHVPLRRHMNIPVLDGDRIVAVAGVGNKKEDYTEDDVRQMTLMMDGMWRILCRKRAEESLRENEEKLRTVTTSLPGAIFQFYFRPDGEMGMHYVDGRLRDVLQLRDTPDDMVFGKFAANLDPRDRQRFLESVQEAVTQVTPWHFEGRYMVPWGETLWWSASSVPQRRENEIVFNGMMVDITDQKRVEEALRQSEERYRTLFHSCPTPLREEDYSEVKAYIDRLKADGVVDFPEYFQSHPEAAARCAGLVKVVDLNRAALDLHHARTKEELLAGLSNVFTESTLGSFRDALVAIARGQLSCDSEAPVRTLDGQEKQILVRWAVAPGCEETLSRAYVAQLDITQLRETERELRNSADSLRLTNAALEKSRGLAEAASHAKSEFLANMSHEIRTPMTAILGYADILAENARDPESIEAADTINRNGQYLLDIINNILDISKIEAQKLAVEPTACSPVAIVSEVLSLMRVRADAKNLELVAEFDGPVPKTITTDPVRLRQILINLIGNAVKFTELGSVRVVTGLQEQAGSAPLLRFEVIDSGIGMTEAQIARLFQPFAQADTSTSRRFGGSGLGLTISRRLAQLLGGDILVRSALGAGTSFTVVIDPGPFDRDAMVEAATEAVAGDRRPPSPEHGDLPALEGRVLLVEDGPDNQRLLAFVLRKAGAQVELAENGQAAIEAITTAGFAAGQSPPERCEPFDVILMDMQMPVMDGYLATRQLRSMGYGGPIIALTAHAMNQDRQRCLDAGCDDYLRKPVERRNLLVAVAKYLPLPSRPAAAP